MPGGGGGVVSQFSWLLLPVISTFMAVAANDASSCSMWYAGVKLVTVVLGLLRFSPERPCRRRLGWHVE